LLFLYQESIWEYFHFTPSLSLGKIRDLVNART